MSEKTTNKGVNPELKTTRGPYKRKSRARDAMSPERVGLSYEQRISKSKESIDKEKLKFEVEEGNIQFRTDILASEKLVSAARRALEDSKGAVPINPRTIITCERDLALKNRDLVDLIRLQAELFLV